jgi:GGDEF domain-containing protein
MIVNHSYRPGMPPRSRIQTERGGHSLSGLRLALRTERYALALIGFGLATAAWTAAIALNPALMPVSVLPALATARYRDRRVAAVAIAASAIAVSIFTRLPSLELAVWFAILFAVALSGLYLLAEKMVIQAPQTDPIARFLRKERTQDRNMSEVVLDCDGLDQISSRYGEGARTHVARLLGRTIQHETPKSCFIGGARNGTYTIVFPHADQAEIVQAISRIRQSFSQAVRDAGYECSIWLAELPASGDLVSANSNTAGRYTNKV